MSQQPNDRALRRFFANFYERTSNCNSEQKFMHPLRQEIVGQAHGLVLEIGAGNGLNFAFYNPETVERVEAIEPSTTMLSYARTRAASAPVSVNLTQAPAENLPFPDAIFDTIVVTLVFCSVDDPLRALNELQRVLKPAGTLLMLEHVRAHGAVAATIQNIITPIHRRVAGNCHWNRDTENTVQQAGFTIEHRRDISGFLLPFVVLRAVK
jgi:ubiquinone/menaquinone biosynthesis C-methylase UbiE